MTYHDVISQEPIRRLLQQQVVADRIPHAQLFAGPEGSGKMAMALAFAGALLCEHPHEGAPCGSCQSCRLAAKLAHPDLHFVFPVIKQKGQSGEAVSDQYLDAWREMVTATPYFDHLTWLGKMGVENQQSQIGVGESNLILQKLSRKARLGRRKVMIIWLPELMNVAAANKLLKILEEPPVDTCFLLISNAPRRLLTTILSRTQRIDFPPIAAADIEAALQQRHGLQPDDARVVARLSNGSYTKACAQLKVDEDRALFFDMFVLLMRLSYQRKIKDLHEWSERVAAWGRERQKDFLDYCLALIRENFIYNFSRPELNYMNRRESDFAVRFARFINERNVIDIMEELNAARRDVVQNVNAKMIFFDFSLKMIVLLLR
jgi:DNA polymerase-3 subunit delta'